MIQDNENAQTAGLAARGKSNEPDKFILHGKSAEETGRVECMNCKYPVELEIQNRKLREAQQSLQEACDQYVKLYDFAPVGYFTLNAAGHILEINLTGATMLGLERADIINTTLAARLVPEDIHSFRHHLDRVFHSTTNVVTELKILNRDGKQIDVRLESVVMLSDTNACLTVMTNITEQKRLALALQQTRLEQDALLSTIPAIVFYKDVNLRYIAVNEMFTDFVGRPIMDVLGKTDFELFSPERAENFQRTSREVLISGKLRPDLERELIDMNGHTVCFSTVLAPFHNPEGRIVGLVGVGIDISQIKMAASQNQELLLQNRTLTQGLFNVQEDERRYLARELHDELGQWLTAIHAEAQAIDSMNSKEAGIAASARAISTCASKMHIVIRGMLRQLRPALLDELGLEESLRELVNQWKQHHPGVASELVLQGNLSKLGENVNITLYRIVQEALSNISRYAEADQVYVNLCLEPGSASDGNIVSLCVKDNGKGFDVEHTQKGLGSLGMRERVIAAGGEFSLCSTPGLGVSIHARLPAR